MSYYALCSEPPVLDAFGAVQCPGTLSVVPDNVPVIPFDYSTLDPTILAEAFGWGVFLIVMGGAIAVAINTILKTIRSL